MVEEKKNSSEEIGRMKKNIKLEESISLKEKTDGVIYNSVGTLRYAPRHNSEMVSQALLGTHVKVLEKNKEWLKVQTPDDYTGWIIGSVKLMTQNELQQYHNQPKVIVTSTFATSYEKEDDKSLPVSDLVIGNILILKSETEQYFEVGYPDGRNAYVKQSDTAELSFWLNNIELNGESIVNTAFRFMGVPYLWGGTSSKGLDCSGFTKNVYFMHGIILSRDASQQVNQGQFVDSMGDFSTLLPGDMVFFGTKSKPSTETERDKNSERVVHVGIYIGNNRFIHASDNVHISSFNPDDELYDEFNAKRYLRAKRYIANGHAVNVNRYSL